MIMMMIMMMKKVLLQLENLGFGKKKSSKHSTTTKMSTTRNLPNIVTITTSSRGILLLLAVGIVMAVTVTVTDGFVLPKIITTTRTTNTRSVFLPSTTKTSTTSLLFFARHSFTKKKNPNNIPSSLLSLYPQHYNGFFSNKGRNTNNNIIRFSFSDISMESQEQEPGLGVGGLHEEDGNNHNEQQQQQQQQTDDDMILGGPLAIRSQRPILIPNNSTETTTTTTTTEEETTTTTTTTITKKIEFQMLSFYHFDIIENPPKCRDALFDTIKNIPGLRGSIYLAKEGVNAQMAVPIITTTTTTTTTTTIHDKNNDNAVTTTVVTNDDSYLQELLHACKTQLPFDPFMENPPNLGDIVPLSMPTFNRLIVRTRDYVLRDGIPEVIQQQLNWNDAGVELSPQEWHAELVSTSSSSSSSSNCGCGGTIDNFSQQEQTHDDDDEEKIKTLLPMEDDTNSISTSSGSTSTATTTTSQGILLDCRNGYESDQGTFDGAIPLGTNNFQESWHVLEEMTKDLSRDEPVRIFCTGGIRCVKVGAYLKQHLGFTNVQRLQHGIIGYQQWYDNNNNGNGNNNIIHNNNEQPEQNEHDKKDHESTTMAMPSVWKGTNFLFDKRRFANETQN